MLLALLRACSINCTQHDDYGKTDDKKTKKEFKSTFYDPPEFYIGRWGLGHFGEGKKGSSNKKSYSIELQSETAAYDDEGYDRWGVVRQKCGCCFQVLLADSSVCRAHGVACLLRSTVCLLASWLAWAET